MNIYLLCLFFILKFCSIYDCATSERGELIKFTIPRSQRKIVQKERDRGDIDLFRAFRKGDMIDIKAVATKKGKGVLNKAKIKYRVLEESLFSYRRRAEQRTSVPGVVDGEITFNRDLHYNEIIDYLKGLEQKSTKNRKISVETIGKSFEDRELMLVKIEHPGATNIMFLDAGIHAREWLAITTALYLITRLIEADHKDEINKVNWYINPCVNPDGYVYSYTKERYHRKNMNFTLCPTECNTCGIDLNRNYDHQWGVQSEVENPCGETYPGIHAFSEPESTVAANTLKKYASSVKLYIAIHSYGCDLLYPWGYEEKKCDDAADLIEAAEAAARAMNKLKTKKIKCTWDVANAGTMPGGGAADDYAKGVLNIKYSYTMELQGGDPHGFSYNRSLIKPFVKQSYAGIKALTEFINDKYSNDNKSRSKRTVAKSEGSIVRTAIILPCVVILHWLIAEL